MGRDLCIPMLINSIVKSRIPRPPEGVWLSIGGSKWVELRFCHIRLDHSLDLADKQHGQLSIILQVT